MGFAKYMKYKWRFAKTRETACLGSVMRLR